jgi:HEPN domain-containing protein
MITRELKGWLIKANNDIRVIQVLLKNTEEELITDVICFHSQQAIEKFLKSFLIYKNISYKKTHNLDYLQDLCTEQDKDFAKFNFDLLSDYAVDSRYGDELIIPSDKTALESFNIALEIKNFVLKKLNLTDKDLIL